MKVLLSNYRWRSFRNVQVLLKAATLILVLYIIRTLFLYSPFCFSSIKCGLKPFENGECFKDNRSHDYQYIHNEADLCRGNVLLLIMIPSSPDEFLTRQAIRDSWGSVASRSSNVRLAFILGYPVIDHVGVNRLIHEESNKYHDVIQKDFIDSYRNLSIKSESILHFTSTYCQSAKFLLKSDSDVFINVKSLVKYLQNQKDSKVLAIVGHLSVLAMPIWDNLNKWGIQSSDYPFTYYPNYVGGPAYIIPGKFVKPLFEMSLRTHMLWLEDVYITGIVRKRLGLPIENHPRFGLDRCSLIPCESIDNLSCHRHSQNEHIALWKLFELCRT